RSKARARRPESRPEWLKQIRSRSKAGLEYTADLLLLFVGGGLLPIAVLQLIHDSKAGLEYTADLLLLFVGGGLLPIAVLQLIHELTDTPLSGASPLPQFD
ncbi:hypothetical protein, partial [Pseudomonas sp. ICMP 460]|uniref:hypothetical protein n=1 Tax=Pseudomonas sp. ICMP 460 TaxID=1718917 RepID=UPI001C477C61